MPMYLRPGNLFKEFLVKRKESDISNIGLPVTEFKDTGILVDGVLAEASTDDQTYVGSGSALSHTHYRKLELPVR